MKAADPLRPRRPGGMGRGAMMALLVHAGLLGALAFGVSWRSSDPAGVTAELWAAVPEVAAPAGAAPPPEPRPEPRPVTPPEPRTPPPPPKPEVNEAEIALEKAKVEKARREREEKEARDKAEAQKKRELAEKAERDKAEREKALKQAQAEKARAEKAEKAEAERLAKLREDNMKRLLGQTGATGAPQSTGTAQRDAGPSASYAGRIVAKVKPNIVLTESVPATLRAEVEVRAAPDGTILGRRLVKPSGNKDWDDAVLRAIDRTETLPRDTDGRVPSLITIGFTPV
jgi:colicin import membrane protein